MRPQVFMPHEKCIHDLLDLLRVVGMPMAEAMQGAELASFGGKSRTSDITVKVA
jgi:hypothetical protein